MSIDLRPLLFFFWVGVVAVVLAPFLVIAPFDRHLACLVETAVLMGLALAQLWDWAATTLRDRRHAREHAEFMALRDIFYARTEVCLDTLEQLRQRARFKLGEAGLARYLQVNL